MITKEIMNRRPEFLMKQYAVAFFMTNDATFIGRSIDMAAIAMIFFPARIMRSRTDFRMAGGTGILFFVARHARLPVPCGFDAVRF